MAIGTRKIISVSSLVSGRTREGVVECTWGDEKGQLSPDEARQHALGVIQCAEAAETDAFIVEFFEQELKASYEEALQILVAFRSFREARKRKH